jgi:hypothetical protein
MRETAVDIVVNILFFLRSLYNIVQSGSQSTNFTI